MNLSCPKDFRPDEGMQRRLESGRAKLSRRNVELQEVRQIWRTFVVYRFEARPRSSADEPRNVVLNFLRFVNELLRKASE